MFCYKDTEFCILQHCIDFSTCHRALTRQVREDAIKWMKDAPICTSAEIPKCFKLTSKSLKSVEGNENKKRKHELS